MSRATNSLRIYALFLLGFGGVFTLAPNFFLEAIRVEPTDQPWIRMMGVLTMAVGLFYWKAAQAHLTVFYWWSVGVRFFTAACIVTLVAVRLAPALLLAFAGFDVLFALWSWTDLRSDDPATSPDRQDPWLFWPRKKLRKAAINERIANDASLR